MRIVSLTEFLALPAGTVFSKYAPCYFEALSIKGDSLPRTRDFCFQQIADAIECSGDEEFGDRLDSAEADPRLSLKMDFESEGRDGTFEEGQRFAVWEPADVAALIVRLQLAMKTAAG